MSASCDVLLADSLTKVDERKTSPPGNPITDQGWRIKMCQKRFRALQTREAEYQARRGILFVLLKVYENQ